MSDERYADQPAQGSGTVTRSGDAPLGDRPDAQPGSGDAWSAPQQRQGGIGSPTASQHALFQHSDLRDQPPIFIASQFRDLRARLFGSRSLNDYPVAVDDFLVGDESETELSPSLDDAQLTLDLDAPVTRPDVVSPGSAASPSTPTTPLGAPPHADRPTATPEPPAGLDPDLTTVETIDEPETSSATPMGPIDWTTVSPQYAPRTERSDSWSRLTALIALALVITGVGVWLLFGPNAPRRAPNARPSAPSSDPVSLGAVGLRSNVDIKHGKTLIVSQEVVFNDPVPTVTLTVPDRSDADATKAFHPQVTQLEVSVDGAIVDIPDAPLESGDSIAVTLPEPSRAVTIDYQASGAVIVSKPSKEGRGLALTNVVSVSPTDGLTTTIDVNGPRILNLGCLEPGGEMFACGWSDVDDVWEYSDVLGGIDVDVLAQVDLPN